MTAVPAGASKAPRVIARISQRTDISTDLVIPTRSRIKVNSALTSRGNKFF
jgi:hypothetical protein